MIESDVFTHFKNKVSDRIDEIFQSPEKYGYINNFLLQIPNYREQLTTIHDAALLLHLAATLDKLSDDSVIFDEINNAKTLEDKFVVMDKIAEIAIPLNDAGSEKKNLLTNKMFSQGGFIIDLPICILSSKQYQIDRTKALLTHLGINPNERWRMNIGSLWRNTEVVNSLTLDTVANNAITMRESRRQVSQADMYKQYSANKHSQQCPSQNVEQHNEDIAKFSSGSQLFSIEKETMADTIRKMRLTDKLTENFVEIGIRVNLLNKNDGRKTQSKRAYCGHIWQQYMLLANDKLILRRE